MPRAHSSTPQGNVRAYHFRTEFYVQALGRFTRHASESGSLMWPSLSTSMVVKATRSQNLQTVASHRVEHTFHEPGLVVAVRTYMIDTLTRPISYRLFPQPLQPTRRGRGILFISTAWTTCSPQIRECATTTLPYSPDARIVVNITRPRRLTTQMDSGRLLI